jgi:hypothetical protein
MSDIWPSESVNGNQYEFEFRNEQGKFLVQVHKVTSIIKTGPTTEQITTDGFPIERRDLPLDQQEAESFARRYLSDLHPKTLELVIARLVKEPPYNAGWFW